MKEIIVTIGTDGSSKVETKGFAGAECLKATADLEAALGKKTNDTKTREFHATASATNVAKQGNR